jgi:hypothetical protein
MTKATILHSLAGQVLSESSIQTPPSLLSSSIPPADDRSAELQEQQVIWKQRFGDRNAVTWKEAREFFQQYGLQAGYPTRPNTTSKKKRSLPQ